MNEEERVELAEILFPSIKTTRDEIEEKYPERKIYTVDTLAASMGQGLLVWYAANMKNDGKSIEEVTAACERDNFMSAEEAMAFGLIDRVLEHH